MAGHSHWKNIKRKKEAADRKKSQAFTKAAQKIIAALRKGDTNPETNYELKVALEYAKQVRMPKENVQRLIEKYKAGAAAQEVAMYEIFTPGGVPALVKVMTDNTNRVLTELRTFLRKNGGRLVEKGSLSWQFNEVGKIIISLEDEGNLEESLLNILDLIEVNDYQEKEGTIILLVPKEKVGEFAKRLLESGYKVVEADIHYVFTGASTDVDPTAVSEFVENLKDTIADIVEVWTGVS